MSRSEIQNLALQLSAEDPYYALGFRDRPDKLAGSKAAERVALAWADPAFGFNVANTHAAAGQPLPGLGWPSEIIRAHQLLLHPEQGDGEIEWALLFNRPSHAFERGVLRALLLCFESSFEQIAAELLLPCAVVRAFETLNWNCRDRQHDRLYLARLCQLPGFRYRGSSQNPLPDREAELLRLAIETGRAELILAETKHGRKTTGSIQTLPQENLERLLRSVLARLKDGKVSKQDNPWLEPILASMARQLNKPAGITNHDPEFTLPQAIEFALEGFLPKETASPNSSGDLQS